MVKRRRRALGAAVAICMAGAACSSDASNTSATDADGASSTAADGSTRITTADFASRATAYLQRAASVQLGERDSRSKVWRAVAQLALDPSTEVDLTPADFVVIDERFAEFADTTDFDMVALINLWYRSDHGARLTELLERTHRAIDHQLTDVA